MEAIVEADLSICADAMGGAGGAYWHAIRDTYGLNLDIRNDTPDPTFAFMHRDHDGKPHGLFPFCHGRTHRT